MNDVAIGKAQTDAVGRIDIDRHNRLSCQHALRVGFTQEFGKKFSRLLGREILDAVATGIAPRQLGDQR